MYRTRQTGMKLVMVVIQFKDTLYLTAMQEKENIGDLYLIVISAGQQMVLLVNL